MTAIEKPLNLLYVFADQMHAFAMGCMGTSDIHTPNFDRLASQGTLFTNAYSACPICSPFRVALFSGLYASQNRHTRGLLNRAWIPEGVATLPEALNAGGYQTSYVGKWHIGDFGHGPIPEELRAGFTDFIGYQCYNDFIDEVVFCDEDDKKHRYEGHRTDITTDIAIERLGRIADGPFSMFVSYQNPHYPIQPSPEYDEMYRGVEIQRRPNSRDVDPFTATGSPPSPRPLELDPQNQRYGGNLGEYLRLYYAMVTQLDANVGRLLDTLDELGLADSTAVIFTSDHGDMQGSQGLRNKCLPYEESAGIPLIVRVPGGHEGLTSGVTVDSVDFYSTILELAGLPKDDAKEGVSFVPVLFGDSRESDSPAFSEMGSWCMIRDGVFKLVCDRVDDGSGLTPSHLFDLETDPYEMNDRVDDPVMEGARIELLGKLTAWNEHVGGNCTETPPQEYIYRNSDSMS
jgi:arylsulfatase A-like enzyme